MRKVLLAGLAVAAALSVSSVALATPYASGVQDLGGGMYSFVLNEDADSVVVDRTGDTSLDLGALAKGSHTFSIGGGSAFQIQAAKTTAAGWTQISDDTLTQSKYYSPRGVEVDGNPMRSTFGRIYVGEGMGGAVAAGGRTTTDGIYIMSADQGDVTSQGDTAYGGGIDWSLSSHSPFKVSLNRRDPTGSDYNLYMGDWSDAHSGLWTADALNPGASFAELLDNTGRDAAGLVLENGGMGPGELHGSVPSGPWVEGTGSDRKLYTVDEDVRRGNVLQYNIGTTTAGYAVAPGDRVSGYGGGTILNGLMDVVRDEDGSWWIAQYRYTDTDSVPSLSHWADGASTPSWKSGPSTVPLNTAYGSIDIHDGLDLLAMGTRSGKIFILDISGATPVLLDTITHSGSYIRDVAFDAAGNLYVVSSSSETLRIYSPGGDWLALTGSDGSFSLIPEPATLLLIGLGGLGLLRRRRRFA